MTETKLEYCVSNRMQRFIYNLTEDVLEGVTVNEYGCLGLCHLCESGVPYMILNDEFIVLESAEECSLIQEMLKHLQQADQPNNA